MDRKERAERRLHIKETCTEIKHQNNLLLIITITKIIDNDDDEDK